VQALNRIVDICDMRFGHPLFIILEMNIFFSNTNISHVRCVPCHNGVARPQVADGGDALQLWREAANILNKQSRTADKGWSSGLGELGVGLTTPHRKNKLVTKMFTMPRTRTDSFDKRPK
jgi:hypothetical protein